MRIGGVSCFTPGQRITQENKTPPSELEPLKAAKETITLPIIRQKRRKCKVEEVKKFNLMIRPEFRDKIPPLTLDEFERLEANILEDGVVIQPIITWNGYIIDGHNRWKIIQKHPDIPYTTKEMHFENQDQAEAWICTHQLGRRNLTPAQRTYLIGVAYSATKKAHGAKDGWRGNQHTKLVKPQNGDLPDYSTAKKVGSECGVGKNTVLRAEQYSKAIEDIDAVSSGFKDSILSGKINMTQKEVVEMSKLPAEEKKEAVQEVLSEKKKPRKVFRRTKETVKLDKQVAAAIDSLYRAEEKTERTTEDVCAEFDYLVDGFLASVKSMIERNVEFFNDSDSKNAFFFQISRIEKELAVIKEKVL